MELAQLDAFEAVLRASYIKLLRDKMLASGHHHARGCESCFTANMLIETLEKCGKKPAESDDGVVVTVYEAGK